MDTPEVSSTYSTPRRSARSDGSLARGDARLWESLGRQYQLVVQSLVSLDVPSEAKELLTQGLHKLGDLHKTQQAHLHALTASTGRFQPYPDEQKWATRYEELRKDEEASLAALSRRIEETLTRQQAEIDESTTKHLKLHAEVTKLTDDLAEAAQQLRHRDDTIRSLEQLVSEKDREIKAAHRVTAEERREAVRGKDEVSDMQGQIETLHGKVKAKEIEVRDLRHALASEKAAHQATQRKLSAAAANLNLTRRTHAGQEAHWRAEKGTMQFEITSLTEILEAATSRLRRLDEIEAKAPDVDLLLRQGLQDAEVIHSLKQVIAHQCGEHAAILQAKRDASLGTLSLERRLTSACDRLEDLVKGTERGTAGRIDPASTLLAVYPDPCQVGRELFLVATTRDAHGCPARGARREEWEVREVEFPSAGPVVVGDVLDVTPSPEDGLPSTSTFIASFRPQREGRAGFRVSFRGRVFTVSGQCPCPLPHDPMDTAPQPAITVSCSPEKVAPLTTMTVTIAVRESGSPVPVKSTQGIEASHFRLVPCGAAAGCPVSPLVQVPGGFPIFTCTVDLAMVTHDELRNYAGMEVLLRPNEAGRGSTWLVANPSKDPHPDPTSFTITCRPAVARIGVPVTAVIVPRTSHFLPVTIEDGVEVRPVGCVEELAEATPSQHSALVTTFTPREEGRAGVEVALRGTTYFTRCTVQVTPPKPFVPRNTVVELSTPPSTESDARVLVTISTRDEHLDPAPGPHPSAFSVTTLGGACKPYPVTRDTTRDDLFYSSFMISSLTTAPAGVTIMVNGASVSATLRSVAKLRDASQAKTPTLPIHTAFQRDPVPPGCTVLLLVCGADTNPLRLQYDGGQRMPVVKGVTNVAAVGAAVRHGTFRAWSVPVTVGDAPGSAAVTVELDGAVHTASVSVEVADTMELQVTRAEQLALDAEEVVRVVEDERARLAEERRDLEAQREVLLAQQHAASPESPPASPSHHPPEYMEFGVHVSDGVTFGAMWEWVDGAKVCGVTNGGPAASAGVREHDVVKRLSLAAPMEERVDIAVHQVDDLRRAIRSLSHRFAPPYPPVTLTVERGEGDATELAQCVVHPTVCAELGAKRYTRTHPASSSPWRTRSESPSPERIRQYRL